ncbi:hypothetical protein OG21DRAFT_1119902 [Imleria badia]|nr:hypothetical protein OG21DRAFT_1119902 [Imleria badia]
MAQYSGIAPDPLNASSSITYFVPRLKDRLCPHGFRLHARITDEIMMGLYICADVHPLSFYQSYLFWLPVIMYDTMLCLLALWHSISNWRSEHPVRRMDGVNITDTLVKGNLRYFLCITLTCVVNVVIGECFGLPWTEVFQAFPAPMEAVIGCRLILSLRSSLVQDEDEVDRRLQDDASWVVLDSLSRPTLLV